MVADTHALLLTSVPNEQAACYQQQKTVAHASRKQPGHNAHSKIYTYKVACNMQRTCQSSSNNLCIAVVIMHITGLQKDGTKITCHI